MSTTSEVTVTPGTGANIATWSITEDGQTKQIQRVGISDSTGAEVLGLKTDAAATQTDGTSISFMSVFKQISASVQALAAWLTGGIKFTRTIIPASTAAVVIKSSPGQVFKIRASNNGSTIAYIKLYDATSATAGTGTPVETVMIPAGSSDGAGIEVNIDAGAIFQNGITFIVTTGLADNDTGAPAAGAYVVTVYYK